MERIHPTEQLESNGGQTTSHVTGAEAAPAAPAGGPSTPDEAATAKLPALHKGGTQAPATQAMAPAPPPPGGGSLSPTISPSLTSSGRERCPLCASPVAPDQRYCVECGQRLAHARPTLLSDTAQRPASSTPPPRKRRLNWSPNGTLIAGIATLLLAMGVGVLIGHYSASGASPKRAATPTVQLLPSAGATGTTGTTSPTAATPGAAAKSAGAKSAAAASSSGGSSVSHNGNAPVYKPPNPTVQVGQKGSGPGYQHHEFTGHFFGGENEENAGEEAEEGSGSGKGGKKK